jgi:hypothetical protein
MEEVLIDAAMNGADGSGDAFFFLADQFVNYDWNRDRVFDGVRSVSEWSFPASFKPDKLVGSLNAALKGRHSFTGKGYFFKNQFYTRSNLANFGMETADATSLSAWHFDAPFLSGVEAAFNGSFSRATKAYFFKGNQYIRYDWVSDKVDAGYPKPITSLNGIPADFASGVDAAIDGDRGFAGIGYLFRGKTYLRYNWNSNGGEPFGEGPARSTQDNWPGLVELLMAGKAKAEAMTWINKTLEHLNQYLTSLSNGTGFFDKLLIEAALSAHFHIGPSQPTAAKIPLVRQIITAYNSIIGTFNLSSSTFKFKTDAEAIAEGVPPAISAFATFNGSLSFTRSFATNGPHTRAAIVIHESVHRFDNLSGSASTHIPEWYVTDANAIALGLPVQPNNPNFATRYDLMSTANSLHNSSSYAAFAQHVFNRSDTRFGAGRANL